jgi:poly-gamma-glutamate synthesis protein (capsule biosynthesis protein)
LIFNPVAGGITALNDQEIVLYAAGDVGPNRENPDTMFQHVTPLISQGDIAFCQLEPALSRRGTPLPQARLAMRADPAAAGAIRRAGFDVVSFASNHCMDWGVDAFFDTIQALQEQGLHVIGVGANLEEARRPAIIRKNDTAIAFLGYNSILPQGYWAEKDRPGCAPLRAHTLYEQIEHDQPGTPARIHTFTHRGDLEAMREDIRKARQQADIVIVSMHNGIHFVPAVIADYQKEAARAAIDAGADLVLCHHTHILKGTEVYKGKAIFYSLANFALESPFTFDEKAKQKDSFKEIQSLSPDWKPEKKSLPPDSYKTILVKCVIRDRRIARVSFLPVQLNDREEPEVLTAEDPRFADIVAYMEEISASQGLETGYRVEGDEVVLTD